MPPRCGGGQLDAAEVRAGHAGDAVVLRQPLVQERVPRVQEIGERAVLAQDRIEEQARLRLMASRSSGLHSGNFCGSGLTTSRLRSSSHWPAKLSASAAERGSASMRFTCASSVRRGAQLAGFGERRAVRRPASSSTGSSSGATPVRRRRSGATSSDRSGSDRARCGKEVRRDQHRLERQLDALLRRLAVGLRHRDELHQRRDFRLASPAGGRRDAPGWRRSSRRTPGPDFGSQIRIFLRLAFSTLGRDTARRT